MNKQDASHTKASELISNISGPIVTTEWVLVEVADAFCKPRNRGLFAKLMEYIEEEDRIELVQDSSLLFQQGTQHYLNRPDKSWSLTDCISFVVMEEQNITEALTGDHYFTQAGFVALFQG